MVNKFIVIQIKSGVKVLKNWYGCNIPEESTLMDIYTEFASGKLELQTLLIMNICSFVKSRDFVRALTLDLFEIVRGKRLYTNLWNTRAWNNQGVKMSQLLKAAWLE